MHRRVSETILCLFLLRHGVCFRKDAVEKVTNILCPLKDSEFGLPFHCAVEIWVSLLVLGNTSVTSIAGQHQLSYCELGVVPGISKDPQKHKDSLFLRDSTLRLGKWDICAHVEHEIIKQEVNSGKKQ